MEILKRFSPVPVAALDLLFPPRCAFCGSLLEHSGSGVCPDCECGLPYRTDGGVQELEGFPCITAFYYDGAVKEGVHALKFGKKSWRAEVFGRYIAENTAECFPDAFDAVTFVPVSFRRSLERGFDQAQLLARSAAKTLRLPMLRTLRKIRNNRAQSSLTDPGQRRENVKGVYRSFCPAKIKGRRFLLVDDVITTGSTITASATVLLDAGAKSVVCASLAGGHGGPPSAGNLQHTEPVT
ncbi:MAG: ComF family protein [Oscillospiraceae bacterium]|nr:ComF family protein [Oscillospiraceae bacterium]